jgi:hypothetical protein
MKDKLEMIKDRLNEDEIERDDLEWAIETIGQLLEFIEGCEFDLTPEFRAFFPKGL